MFDLLRSPYPSRRSPVLARHGMVSTSHPLAAQIGVRVLMEGGNAVDAAVATAAALAILSPTSNGLGGDAFALVWDGRRLHGLNASGRAPRRLTLQVFREQGLSRVPLDGWMPVTVPGVVSAWIALHERFGTLPLTRLLQPAARYAEEGHPVQPVVAFLWRAAEERFGHRDDFHQVFLPNGRAPRPGDVFRLPQAGRTLRLIAESGGEAFYRGELAERMVAYAEQTGGYFTLEDFAEHQAEWVEPISTTYRGYRIWEIPPNGQGITALIALNLLEGYDIGRLPHRSAEEIHLTAEALKLAFADAYRYVADPARAPVPVTELLNKDYASLRRRSIDEGRANRDPTPGLPSSGDTVYLCTADESGMMVSFIQSNFHGFGSGVVDPATGIHFQNRGAGFTLDPDHPNVLEPGKRPFHTIIPGFITAGDTPLAAFGVMGGDMQPQGHMQVVMSVVDYHLHPQAALDAPRIKVYGGARLALEPTLPVDVAHALARWGHEVMFEHRTSEFGGGKMIWRDPETGVLIGGTEPRQDGAVVGF